MACTRVIASARISKHKPGYGIVIGDLSISRQPHELGMISWAMDDLECVDATPSDGPFPSKGYSTETGSLFSVSVYFPCVFIYE